MSVWRFLRGWTAAELQRCLAEQRGRPVSFDTSPEQMTAEQGWTVDGDDAPIAFEPSGPPLADGPFVRARQALLDYDFSDPGIVVGHFDRQAPLEGRDMLLELKVWALRFLSGVRVRQIRDESDEHRTSFGYRYDTLAGHIEHGFEWFLLSKNHESGEVRFRIEAHWRHGQFPNWWSRVGFLLVGERYRVRWRRRAIRRLRRLAQQASTAPGSRPSSGFGQLEHQELVSAEQPQRRRHR